MSGSGDDGRWQTESGWHSGVEWELDATTRTQKPVGRRGRGNGPIAVVALAGLATVAIIIGLLATSPTTEPSAETAAAETEPTPARTPRPAPDLDLNNIPSAVDIDDAVDLVQERAAEAFRRQLTLAAVEMGIVYRSGEQLTLVNFEDGEISAISNELTDPEAPEVELLRAGDGRTYAINPETREATVVATDGYVVDTMFDGLVTRTTGVGTTEPGEVAILEPLAGGPPRSEVALPTGAGRVVLPGVGMVLVSGSGSKLVGPDELIHLSDNAIVAGNTQIWLEEIRTGPATSRLQIVDFESRQPIAELPEAFASPGDTFVVSPTGSHILRVSLLGVAEFYTVVDGGVSFVTGGGIENATFAPDGSFIAWLDTTGRENPFLQLMFIEPRRAWVSIDLSSIGASIPDGTEVLVYS